MSRKKTHRDTRRGKRVRREKLVAKKRRSEPAFESFVSLLALQEARHKVDEASAMIRAAEDDIRNARKP
jgi:hypothetical protein